jgi:hypothetical protein
MMQQGIDQRAVEIARCGMDDQPGRLVHHDQRLVLVGDDERNVLRHASAGAAAGTRTANMAPGATLSEAWRTAWPSSVMRPRRAAP